MSLTVPITEPEHEGLVQCANEIRVAMRGVLFQLVFANHRAIKNHVDEMERRLQSGERAVDWRGEYVQTQLIFANWLGAIRWLLDHTISRYADLPERLEEFEKATNREFDDHFAYRFTYKLRDYSTHCDLPPLMMNVQSTERVLGDRIDSLTVRLDPRDLLDRWDGWGRHVTRDLQRLQDPVDLVPLVDDAMACIERLMLIILAADVPDLQRSARQIVEAFERLPEDSLANGQVPMLIAIEMEESSVRRMIPTPLPISAANQLLNPPGPSREPE